MNFEIGDIVVIEWHPLPHVVGRSAEIRSVHPKGAKVHPLLETLGPYDTWYTLIDVCGERRAAAHPWLRRMPPLWTPSTALRQAQTN